MTIDIRRRRQNHQRQFLLLLIWVSNNLRNWKTSEWKLSCPWTLTFFGCSQVNLQTQLRNHKKHEATSLVQCQSMCILIFPRRTVARFGNWVVRSLYSKWICEEEENEKKIVENYAPLHHQALIRSPISRARDHQSPCKKESFFPSNREKNSRKIFSKLSYGL